MFVPFAANPSLDRTVAMPGPLARGEVQRAVSVSQESGGKGVNVSRALVASGLETIAVLPGAENDPVLAGLLHDGVPFAALPIDEPLRTNVALTEPGGVTTKINEPGPIMDAYQQEALIGLLLERPAGPSRGVLAGSRPPGSPEWHSPYHPHRNIRLPAHSRIYWRGLIFFQGQRFPREQRRRDGHREYRPRRYQRRTCRESCHISNGQEYRGQWFAERY